jgi:hypothetical protein
MSENAAYLARLMWTLFEPVHDVTYFSPQARASFEAAGLRGFWRGYFAGRAAPLGPVSAAPVVASFFNFAPDMVARAIPDVWDRAGPERVLQARLTGAVQALSALSAGQPPTELDEAADLLEEAAGQLDHAGRVLGAANAALPRPAEPLGRLWLAATVLREHRGDGHVAALVAADLGGCEVLAWRAARDLSREMLQPARGWTDEEWAAAADRLAERGWLDRDGNPTQVGIDAFAAVERATDVAAAGPWRVLGMSGAQRLLDLLTPLARACFAVLPFQIPIGLPAPGQIPEPVGQ